MRLVKEYKPPNSDENNITLAIGDGANDVSMIRGGCGRKGCVGRGEVAANSRVSII